MEKENKKLMDEELLDSVSGGVGINPKSVVAGGGVSLTGGGNTSSGSVFVAD